MKKISEQRPEDELKALRRSLIAAADYLAESGYPKENWGQFCAVHLEPHLPEAKIKQLNTTYRKARLGHE
jgi:tripartite-type tricarboxylate transporter receptor subunit TctC